jgi:ABC-2 type transport system ATP-binding protein
VRSLRAAGTTVLLTTQYLEEADQLADRIVVIDHGTVIADGTTSELKSSVGSGRVQVRLHDPAQRAQAEQILSDTLGVPVHLESELTSLSATATDPERVGSALINLAQAGIVVSDFSLGSPSLDEVFLALTGQPLADETSTAKEYAN